MSQGNMSVMGTQATQAGREGLAKVSLSQLRGVMRGREMPFGLHNMRWKHAPMPLWALIMRWVVYLIGAWSTVRQECYLVGFGAGRWAIVLVNRSLVHR